MAIASQAAILDELMGKHRNDCGQNIREPHWSDEDVCKSFIVGLCPHTLFVNTKADLGPCEFIHDDKMKEKYQKSSRYCKMGYEQELCNFMNRMIDDVERRIKRGNERLIMNGPTLNGAFHEEKIKKFEDITKMIDELIEKAELLGSEGQVAESQSTLAKAEKLRFEQSYYQKEIDDYNQSSKALEVCPICGAFRIKDDAPTRTEEHLLGKMHIGYSEVRDFLKKLNEIIAESRRKTPVRSRNDDKSIKRDRRSRSRSRHDRKTERSNNSKKNKDRSISRSRRDKRRYDDDSQNDKIIADKRDRNQIRDQSHNRSKDKKYDRSRSKDKKRDRSRSKNGKQDKSRSKDKKRDRNRSKDRKRDKSRSKDRKRDKSRSKDRKRDKSRSKDRKRDKSRSKDRKRDKSRSKCRQNKNKDIKSKKHRR